MAEEVELRISLSTFVQFVSSTGTARLDKVLEGGAPYDPKNDFYKIGREAILEAICTGNVGPLESLPSRVHARKAEHYRQCINGMSRLLREHEVVFVRSLTPRGWCAGELEVRVNPEVLLRIDGVLYAIKLHLRAERLVAPGRNCLSYLLRNQFGDLAAPPALLDLRRGILSPLKEPARRTPNLVAGEAAAFVSIWNSMQAA